MGKDAARLAAGSTNAAGVTGQSGSAKWDTVTSRGGKELAAALIGFCAVPRAS